MPRLVLALFLFCMAASATAAEPVTLTAADGVKVFGTLWRSERPRPAVIVAFHQAGSSAAEYAPIAPRLVAAGFTVLAIDQRSGGDLFGANRTADALGREAKYDEALPDLEAALAWARADAKGAPVVVLGSSYSAALVFVLAAKHPGEIDGLVAYSPGEYLADKRAVRNAAAHVTVPVLIDQAASADEVAQSTQILAAVAGKDKQRLTLKTQSKHGASTLRADSNPQGNDAHWQALLSFLKSFAAR